MKFIQLTDIHITPEGETLFGQDTSAITSRAIADIADKHPDAAFCVVTGDITHNGDLASYDRAKALLAELPMPVHVLIGNHDERQPAAQFFDLPQPGGFLQQSIPTPLGTLLLLDTKDDNTHGGAYCDARQAWLRQQLDDNADRPVWLFMHHCPFPLGLPAMDTIQMNPADAQAMGESLARHSQVKHLFFGHYHRPVNGQWHGIPFSSHRSMMLQCRLDFETADEVTAIFEEPQYAVVLVDEMSTRVHLHDFDSSAPVASMGAAES